MPPQKRVNGNTVAAPAPVSYTHLDVYKRQSDVSGQGKQGKHGCSAAGTFNGGQTERTGPENADGKSADAAPNKREYWKRRKGSKEIAANTEQSTEEH